MERLILDQTPPLARVTFNRPEVVNATDPLFVKELLAVGQTLAREKNIRVVLVTGAGRGFCSGIDLKALSRHEITHPWFRQWEEAVRVFETLYDKAVICGIRGACIGGGLQFILACDMRIATEDAFFSLTAVRHSIIPGLGTFRLPRALGLNRGKLLSLVATRIDAQQALAWGLVDKVVKTAELDTALSEAAETFLQTAPTAFRETKKLLCQSFDVPYERFLAAYLKGQKTCLTSADHDISSAAYLEKRTPDFSHPPRPAPRPAGRRGTAMRKAKKRGGRKED
jgi:enoyl-CoA hydratase/carnithine racemase